MTKDEALKLALEALELCNGAETADGIVVYTGQEIIAIKEALAQPEQEPEVCCGDYATCMKPCTPRGRWLVEQEPEWYHFLRRGEDRFVPYKGQAPEDATPLYTTPPQREWVGLTDEELQAVVDAQPLVSSINVYFKAIEAKLKEKNT